MALHDLTWVLASIAAPRPARFAIHRTLGLNLARVLTDLGEYEEGCAIAKDTLA